MIFLVIVPCILCFVYAWRRRQKYLEGKLPPFSIGAWTIIGHLHLWIRGLFWDRLLEMQKDCLSQGGVTYLYSGTNPSYAFYAIGSPKDCISASQENHQYAFQLEDSFAAIFGEGLTTAPVWEKNRHLLAPIFDGITCLEDTNLHARQFVRQLADQTGNGFINPTKAVQNVVMEILFSAVFGIQEFKEDIVLKLETYQTSVEEISRVLFERYRSFLMHKKLFFNCSRLKRDQDECVRVMKEISQEMITMRRDQFNKQVTEDSQESVPTCLLDGLLTLEAKGLYTELQMIDEINTALYSGYETLVNSLILAMVMLGSHPEIQDEIYLEIKNTCGTVGNGNEIYDLSKLQYLEAVIMETLRLYPPVTTTSRVINQGIEIKNYSLKPGSQCLFFLHAMNRHQSWGEDRESFRPGRWLDHSTPEAGLASFGIAKRCCLGKKFAISTMKTVLLHIFKEYRIISDHAKLVVTQRIFLSPVSGHCISLERRRNNKESTVIDMRTSL